MYMQSSIFWYSFLLRLFFVYVYFGEIGYFKSRFPPHPLFWFKSLTHIDNGGEQGWRVGAGEQPSFAYLSIYGVKFPHSNLSYPFLVNFYQFFTYRNVNPIMFAVYNSRKMDGITRLFLPFCILSRKLLGTAGKFFSHHKQKFFNFLFFFIKSAATVVT